MNINRKAIKVIINEREMEMVLDFESAINYQEKMNESIFVGVQRIGKEMDILAFAHLIASTLRDVDGDLVGIDYVKSLDLVSSIDFFMGKLGELMDNSVPQAKEEKNSKKKK